MPAFSSALPIRNPPPTDFLPDSPSDSVRTVNSERRTAVATWHTLLLHGRPRTTLTTLWSMRRPFEAREKWRDVPRDELEACLQAYPRPLEPRPRMTRKSGHREWTDANRGSWPANAVAKAWTRGRNPGYQIR